MALIKCKECGSQISSAAKSCPSCGAKNKKRFGLLGWLGVFFAVSVGYQALNTVDGGSGGSETHSKNPKAEAISGLKLNDLRWGKAAFGSVMEISVSIQNDSQYAVKDIEITCEHSSNSGTVIDRNKKVIYELIPATTDIKLKKFNMGFMHSQATSTTCAITDLVIVQ